MDLLTMKARIKEDILYSMYEYIEPLDEDDDDLDEQEYTSEDVEECGKLLADFIDCLVTVKNDTDKILGCVKTLILALNDLNERLDFSLIETEQREDICGFILSAVNEAGLKTDDDITEEWRDW